MAERLLEPKAAFGVVVVLLLAAALLGAGIAKQSPEPPALQSMGSSGAVFARALGGIRSAAAAYLWIKLDDAHHNFYGGEFKREKSLIPLFRLATWLDPQLQRAYYVGSYMLWIYGRKQDALDFALEGLNNNPNSIMLRMNAGQLYLSAQGLVARREALRHLSVAEKMSRGKKDVFRLEIMGALAATYKKWRIPNEPKAFAGELAELRRLARKRALEVPPEIQESGSE